MAVPTADQERLSHILADDLQVRIQWAYDLEQEIATLSGGGITAWGLASQAQYVYAGDPNGNVTAVADGDFLLDIQTPALWLADGPGTVWTQASGGGGGASFPITFNDGTFTYTLDASGGVLDITMLLNADHSYTATVQVDITDGVQAQAIVAATAPGGGNVQITPVAATGGGADNVLLGGNGVLFNLVPNAGDPNGVFTALQGSILVDVSTPAVWQNTDGVTAWTAVGGGAPSGAAGGDLTGTYPNPTLTTAGPGATGPLGTAARIPVVTIDAKGRVTGLSDVAASLAATGDATGNLPGALTLKNTGPGATGPLGTAVRVPVVTIDAQGRVTGLSDIAIALGATGDATGTLPGALTLKNTGPGATGPSGSATAVSVVTIDAQGRVTGLTTTTIAIPESAVTNLTSDLALKAPLASPTFTGTPAAPTATAGDSSTQLASTAFVGTAINNAISGLNVKADVAYASTSALPANTYSNGTAGVGATLTGNANGPLLIDSVTILVAQAGERVLVAGEAAPANNGWYTITQVGVVAVSPYILTRATDSDQAAEIGAGYLTGVVAPNTVTPGTSNNGKLFISVAADPFTVGTTGLTFSQVGSTYSAGNGIGLSGTTFSIDTAITVDKTTAQTLTNKTLTSPALTTPTGIVATDIASGTFAIGRIPTGTDGTHVPLGGVITGAGPTGDASHTLALTYNAAGQLTAVTNNAIAIAESQVTNLTSDLAAKQSTTLTSAHLLVGNVSNVATDTAVTGDVTITNAGVTAIGATKVTNAMLAGSIDLTAKVTGALPIANGGTAATTKAAAFDALSPLTTAGDILYGGTSGTGTRLAAGTAKQFLQGGATTPAWRTEDGWIPDTNTWVFASTTTFTISGVDATSYLTKGTKISYNDGAVDYGVVASSTFSTNTTVTLITTSDYSIANATLTAPRYSYAATPQGFPGWFNFTMTLSGWSANPTNLTYKWTVPAGPFIAITFAQRVNGTSNNVTHTGTLPVAVVTGGVGGGFGVDNSAFVFNAVDNDGTHIVFLATGLTNVASGGSRHLGQFVYEF